MIEKILNLAIAQIIANGSVHQKILEKLPENDGLRKKIMEFKIEDFIRFANAWDQKNNDNIAVMVPIFLWCKKIKEESDSSWSAAITQYERKGIPRKRAERFLSNIIGWDIERIRKWLKEKN